MAFLYPFDLFSKGRAFRVIKKYFPPFPSIFNLFILKPSLCKYSAYRYTFFDTFKNFYVTEENLIFVCFLLCLWDKSYEIIFLFVVKIV